MRSVCQRGREIESKSVFECIFKSDKAAPVPVSSEKTSKNPKEKEFESLPAGKHKQQLMLIRERELNDKEGI